MHRRELVLAVALLAGAQGGCKKAARELMKKAADTVGEAASGPSAEEQALSLYTEGFNALVDRGAPCAKEYGEKVPEAGPEAGKAYRFFPHCRNSEATLPTLKATFASAAEKAPEELKPLAGDADATLAAFGALLAVSADTVKYYESEAFKDDQGAKGKELHQRNLDATAAFRAGMGKLEGRLSAIEDKRALAELSTFGADKGYAYWYRKASYDANTLLKVKPTDTQALAAAAGELSARAAEFKTFTAGKGTSLQPTFKGFADAYDRFDSAAQRLARSAKDDEKPARLEQEYGQLVQSYNTMVSLANALREVEAGGLLK
jgi:Protein of unknown function (DUF3829)